jgi:hypothetical protein
VRLLVGALDFCIARLAPHVSKSPLIGYRRDQYAHVRKLILSARAPKKGDIQLRIDEKVAALIRPAVVSYIAELKKRAKDQRRR